MRSFVCLHYDENRLEVCADKCAIIRFFLSPSIRLSRCFLRSLITITVKKVGKKRVIVIVAIYFYRAIVFVFEINLFGFIQCSC